MITNPRAALARAEKRARPSKTKQNDRSADHYPGALARAEQIVDVMRTRYICEGWRSAFDEKWAEQMLNYFRNPDPPDVPGDRFVEEVVRWTADHNQSLDWILDGDPTGLICGAAASSRAAPDRRFTAKELGLNHKTLAKLKRHAAKPKGRKP